MPETETESDSAVGMRADVYMNLNKECFSVKSMETDSPEYGTVVAHADAVVVDDPSFVVQEAGLQRAREEDTRNVHAFIRGTIEDIDGDAGRRGGLRAWHFTYDPFEHEDVDKPFIFDRYPEGVPVEDTDVEFEKVLLSPHGSYGLFNWSDLL